MPRADRYRMLLTYDAEATESALASLNTVPEPHRSSPHFAKALGILGHVQMARHEWLARLGWGERRPWVMFPDWSAQQVADDARRLDSAWSGALAPLQDHALAREVVYSSLDGRGFISTAEDILVHVFNHATYHRGQVARLVGQLEGQPARTDLLFSAAASSTPLPDLPGLHALALRLHRADQRASALALDSLRSIPPAAHDRPEFLRALAVFGHLQDMRGRWLAVLGGPAYHGRYGFEARPIDQLEHENTTHDRAWSDLLEHSDDQRLHQPVQFEDWQGRATSAAPHTILTHVFNHSTYHRGQIAMFVSSLGGQRAATDYILLTRTTT